MTSTTASCPAPVHATGPAARVPQSGRLRYIDGLRGLAVGMVLLDHCTAGDSIAPAPAPLVGVRAVLNTFFYQGFEGVSLFLVLSGFCLSYPLLVRRRQGRPDWFRPSEFFARRCLRILPPYYAALALFIAISWAGWPGGSIRLDYAQGPGLSWGNVMSHLLLVHNLTPWYASINGPFWSLGLEWQWYLAFPFVLLLAVRSWRLTAVLVVGAALLWHGPAHDLWQLWPGISGALPARLAEFTCGIGAAGIVTGERQWRGPVVPVLAWIAALPVLVAALPGLPALSQLLFGQAQPQPLYGVSFAALLLLGHYSRRTNRVLSWGPLVGLGICSYSIYLLHYPALQWAEAYAPLRFWPLTPLIGLAAGVGAGIGLYLLVERSCMSKGAQARCLPWLRTAFTWTDLASRPQAAPVDRASAPVKLAG